MTVIWELFFITQSVKYHGESISEIWSQLMEKLQELYITSKILMQITTQLNENTLTAKSDIDDVLGQLTFLLPSTS